MPPGDSEVIRSQSNQVIRYVRSLQRRSTRQAERAFVVEGERAVGDALAAGAQPTLVLVREGTAVRGAHAEHGARVVEARLFDRLCETMHPQGILGVFPFPELPIQSATVPIFLVVDQLRDPGNLGTLLRSAAASGVNAVFLSDNTVDPFNSKVVRAGMGAHFRVPLRALDEAGIAMLQAQTPLRVLADIGDHLPPERFDWRQPATLIIASETEKLRDDVRMLATDLTTIPMASGVDSLNAAVAASVILFEMTRQRRH